ncbi:hypothetical protein LIPSTDRAFT_170668 [Lipomyces starkeyi NRRL Y-11557]|uniref:Uncharacterized protein n=1 Tax=Lipomyces starkeyi NRRL Y-11557 TaxID=675824 RepID=A0A1E3PZ56_LIPST|nr:hypothetical protein LIPSTDRAFT_170668 [Lipomyces starkeyi NRRL Y-11557]
MSLMSDNIPGNVHSRVTPVDVSWRRYYIYNKQASEIFLAEGIVYLYYAFICSCLPFTHAPDNQSRQSSILLIRSNLSPQR